MDKEIFIKRAEELIKEQDLLLIDAIIRGDNKTRIIELFIDGEVAITSEICSKISNIIKSAIEEENLIDSNFRLDVSSPGADRPLKFLCQYPKHINRNFELSYTSSGQVINIKTKLTGIEDDTLTFNNGKNEIRVRFEEIKSAKVIISF